MDVCWPMIHHGQARDHATGPTRDLAWVAGHARPHDPTRIITLTYYNLCFYLIFFLYKNIIIIIN